MKFVNNNNKPVKVTKENTNPSENITLKRNDTIECESENFVADYEEKGLTLFEVKAVEGKAGTKKVETKVIDKGKKKK